MGERLTLILSGGNALGAYQAGAYETLHAEGLHPAEIVAVSTGAINAALIAGSPPQERLERLRRFWAAAAQDAPLWALGLGYWSAAWDLSRMRALQASLLGSPAAYRPRFPGAVSILPGMPGDCSLYDMAPLRESLKRAVDFGRLNSGEVRVTVVTADVYSGEEVRFDSYETPIGIDHLVASCGFIPFFPPQRIDGRLLGDGGLAANLPLQAALEEPAADDRLCIALDLFHRRHQRDEPLPSVTQALDRQLELILSNQSWQALDDLRRRHALRRQLRLLAEWVPAEQREAATLAPALAEAAKSDGAVTLLLLSHAGVPHDAGLRAFDFSRPVLAERWASGRADMASALRHLGGHRAAAGEFVVHAFNGSQPEAAGDRGAA